MRPLRARCRCCAENGIDVDPDNDGILLRREIAATGKGRVFINSQPSTVGVLRLLAPELALVHAQGETLGSFDQAQQRLLLDRFGNISAEIVAEAFAAWCATQTRLETLLADEQDRLRMADMWRFQVKEIEQAGITGPEEDGELEAEKRVLANAERLYAAAMGAHELLYEAETSAETTLGQALRLVEELARFEPKFVASAQELATAKAIVEDLSATVRDFADNVHAGPERLAEIEDRLALLDRLKRKYGVALADVIAFGEDSSRQLAEVENRDAILAELRVAEARNASAYESAAGELTAQRSEAASRLAKGAEKQINDLAMHVRFAVGVAAGKDRSRWSVHGWDEISFTIATNAGEPLKPLDEVASGGEMSRVLLALKVTVEETVIKRTGKKRSALPRTLVFDEIDIGIGGRAAEAVGQKLKALAATQQVICVTHLPQIAAFADQHFLIEKNENRGRTQTRHPADGRRGSRPRDRPHAQRCHPHRNESSSRREHAGRKPLGIPWGGDIPIACVGHRTDQSPDGGFGNV